MFIVSVVFVGITADMLVYSVIIPILPFIVEDLNGSSILTGVMLAVYALGILVSAPLFGYYADRWRNKRTPMICGLFALLVAVLAMAFGNYIWLWIIARMLQGVSAGAVWSLGLALVADAYYVEPKGFAQAMSIIMVGYTVGTVAGPPIGGALYALSHIAPFIFCAAVVFIDLTLRLLVVEPYRADDEGDDEGMVVGGAADAETGNEKAASVVVDVAAADPARAAHKPLPVNFVEMLKSKPLLMVLGLSVVAGVLLASFEPTLPVWLNTTYSLDSTQVGLVFFALVLPPVFCAPVAGFIADRHGAYPLIPIAMTASVAAEVLPGVTVAGSLAWTVVALALVSCAVSFALAPLVPEIAANVPRDAYAKAYSLFNVSWSLGIVVGPTLGATVYQYAGWFWQCVFTAVFAALCLPLAFMYRRPAPR
ncbi:major facilitator superfamily domain-containing protein [Zopfochytrium polystomum]|nr:major facilitator superfamily domain-containing protein [Zopfochytrium polystomum]